MENISENRICQSCKSEFIIELEDFSFFKKIGVPPPTWCPRCRFLRRMTFVNERSLYKRVCGNCNRFIISTYDTSTKLIVWCTECYLSDIWDARDYSRNYDFSTSFLKQFEKLKLDIPNRALYQYGGVDCDYANFCHFSKNVYLSSNVVHCENIMYSKCYHKNNKNCLDSLMVGESDRGYELIKASKNFNSSFLVESDQCIESHFLYDCSNCINCCLSSNLRNKSNVFRNKQLTKDEYKKAIEDLRLETYSRQNKIKEEFKELMKKAIHKYAHIKNSINTIGDFIDNSKNIYNSYGVANSENIKYVFLGAGASTIKDSQDLVYVGRVEESYEFILGGSGASRVICSFGCEDGCKNLFYCDSCRGCSDCFGCVGLKKKQYCILNKQYSNQEYFEMIQKIKKHMDDMPYIDKVGRKYGFGEFFPSELSSFAYNESIAFEEHPLLKEEALSLGYKWKERETKSYNATIETNDIPDSINDVSDSICEETIECLNKGKVETLCTSAFRILPDELSFYRQMNLPIPRCCPNCRYYERLKWINPFNFYHRQCMCKLEGHNHKGRCSEEFETMYSPDRPEVIYCKSCYQREIY